jgi:hypothetical protein
MLQATSDGWEATGCSVSIRERTASIVKQNDILPRFQLLAEFQLVNMVDAIWDERIKESIEYYVQPS